MGQQRHIIQLKDRRGFSLLELALGLMVLSIMLISSSSLMDNLVTAERFEKTVAEIQQLGHLTVGDPNVMQTGHQADFGYFEAHRGWPATVSQLYEFVFEPMSVRQILGPGGVMWHELLQDEWGGGYFIAVPAPFTFQIRAPGEDGNPMTGDDIPYSIPQSQYQGNIVRILITDAAGTALRTRTAALPGGFHQIYEVQLRGYGSPGAYSSKRGSNAGISVAPMAPMTYNAGYFQVTSVQAGPYMITVNPTPGPAPPAFTPGLNEGNYNLTDNLCGSNAGNANQEAAIRKMIMVSPRGFAVQQYFIVKMPGMIQEDEVGDYDAT